MNQDCLPELTFERYELLRDDIRVRGVQNSVEICANSGEILDGRARIRACKELKIHVYPRRVVGGLNTEEARRHHRLKANCLRRQLDRPALKDLVLAEMRRKAQSDRLLAGIFGLSHTGIANWRREFLACGKLLPQEVFEGKGRKYRRPAAIYAHTDYTADRAAKILHELGDDAPAGRHLSTRAAGGLLLAHRKERADRNEVAPPQGVKLYGGRFQDVGGKVRDGSVDCVFTDPPYDAKWVDRGEWADLGALAARVLKPGGLLFTYAGVSCLDRVMRDLSAAGLTYIWTIAVRSSGLSSRQWKQNMINKWKPALVFGKGVSRLPTATFDLWEGTQPRAFKNNHNWEQPEEECEYYLSHIVPAGSSVVLDPCCGSGTTLKVARRLGFRAVGIDQDPEAIALTKERLQETLTKRGTPTKVPAGQGHE